MKQNSAELNLIEVMVNGGISGADVHDIFSLKVARIEALNSSGKIGAIIIR